MNNLYVAIVDITRDNKVLVEKREHVVLIKSKEGKLYIESSEGDTYSIDSCTFLACFRSVL